MAVIVLRSCHTGPIKFSPSKEKAKQQKMVGLEKKITILKVMLRAPSDKFSFDKEYLKFGQKGLKYFLSQFTKHKTF